MKGDRIPLTLAQGRALKPGDELCDWDGNRCVVRAIRPKSSRTIAVTVEGDAAIWDHAHFSLPSTEDRERWIKQAAEKSAYDARQAEIARVEKAFGVRATLRSGGYRWSTWAPAEYAVHLTREDALRLLPLLEASHPSAQP